MANLTDIREIFEAAAPDVDQIMASFCNAPLGDDRASWIQQAGMVASHRIAGDLYLAHVSEADRKWPQIKEWGYLTAVEFVGSRGSGQRRRSMVESYRVDWGHQAARDGMAIAIFGAEGVPGVAARAERFKCGKQAYQRVRDHVGQKAAELITEFRHFLDMARTGRYSGEFIERWETATGAKWDGRY